MGAALRRSEFQAKSCPGKPNRTRFGLMQWRRLFRDSDAHSTWLPTWWHHGPMWKNLRNRLRDSRQEDLNWRLFAAIRAEDQVGALDILAQGADASFADKNGGFSALMFASMKGLDDCVLSLLDRGAPIDAVDVRGSSAISCAVGRVQTVKILARHGANVNIQGRDGSSAAFHAASTGCLETLRLLTWHGADLQARDHQRWSPLDGAKAGGHTGCAQFIEAALLSRQEHHDLRREIPAAVSARPLRL